MYKAAVTIILEDFLDLFFFSSSIKAKQIFPVSEKFGNKNIKVGFFPSNSSLIILGAINSLRHLYPL